MKSKLKLKMNPSIRDFQKYVDKMIKERGFEKETVSELFMLLLEECGEMAKAARKLLKIKLDNKSEKFNLEHEAADVFIYLLLICNKHKISLEKAFREKEKLNKKRIWG